MWSLIAIIFILLTFTFMIKLFLQKQQIENLKKQVDFIIERDTDIKLTSDSKDIIGLTVSINRLMEKYQINGKSIEQSDVLFRETITSLSHDLRTPLATANGYIGLLKSENLTDKQMEYVEITSERIGNLKILLDQLFEFARIEADEIEFNLEHININNILRDVTASFYNEFERKNSIPIIDISDEPFIVWADKDALSRVFSNVLYNAIIHGDRDYTITSKKESSYFIITFSNHSSTITKEDIVHIFNKFYTNDKSRNKKTTGLGLSIAEKLVNKMNGEISANLKEEIFSIIIKFNI